MMNIVDLIKKALSFGQPPRLPIMLLPFATVALDRFLNFA